MSIANINPCKSGLIVSLSFKERVYRIRRQKVCTLIIGNFNIYGAIYREETFKGLFWKKKK